MALSRYPAISRKSAQVRMRGFTIVELVVTVAVMAILLAIAAPSFKEIMLGTKLTSQANSLMASAHLARGEAIKRNQQVRLCASSDGASCTGSWQQGWIVITATDAVIQSQQALPAGLQVIQTEGDSVLSFSPTGVGTEPATLTICQSDPVGSQEREIHISTTGAATIKKTTTGSCS